MDRRDSLNEVRRTGALRRALSSWTSTMKMARTALPSGDALKRLRSKKEFIQNWLSDLLDAMDRVLDKETKIKLIEYCGKRCFERHPFKKDISAKGKGDPEKLIEAYKQKFEI
jgi:hypothetical protein